jgi:hypothetical protein
MKKIYLLSVVLLLPAFIFAQITIDQNDMPNEGDTIRLSKSVDVGMINFEETGNDFTWDFSTLIPYSQTVDTFVSVSETPWVYQLVFFTSSNLAMKLNGFDFIPGFDITDSYEFYNNSGSDFRDVGVGVTINGAPIPNKYDSPDIIYRFPLTVGSVDSSNSSYSMEIPGLGYSSGWKKRVNHIDGWGTLTTPYGTFETVRVKSDVIQHDSIYIDSLGIGFPIDRVYTEYKWLGNNFGLPLCTVTDDGFAPTVTYIDSVRNLFVGIDENPVAGNGFKLYPNPAHSEFTVDLSFFESAEVEISLYNTEGLKIAELFNGRLNAGNSNRKFDISQYNLKEGLYFIVVKAGEKSYAEKLIVR